MIPAGQDAVGSHRAAPTSIEGMQLDPTPVHVAFTQLPDLASEVVGGSVCACNDDFFAEAANLVKASVPVWDADAFTERGKWMDGWESQRGRRYTRPDGARCDTAIITLGIPGEIVGVDVNTAHFLGNAPRSVELHAAELDADMDPQDPDIDWTPLAPRTPTLPGTRNLVPVESSARGWRFTHVRLTIHPDGGVARLRVHGVGMPASGALDGTEIDLASAANGAIAVAASDQFFGGISNLVLPGDSGRMDEGWETMRTRDRVHDDWVVVRLAHAGTVDRVVVDTSHFRGNAPDSVRLEGALLGARANELDLGDERDCAAEGVQWFELAPSTDVGPHAAHEIAVTADGRAREVDHVRLTIEPDGGVARLRVFGTATPGVTSEGGDA